MEKNRILLVEDNPINAKMEYDFLIYHKYDVMLINNGIQAYQSTIDFDPHLIIMDIQLFGVSGVDAAKKIRSSPKIREVPIIAVSSFTKKNLTQFNVDTLFDEYIEKPINFKALLELLNQYMGEQKNKDF